MNKVASDHAITRKKNNGFFEYLTHSPFLFDEEYALLGAITRRLIASNTLLTKKYIALELIRELETSENHVDADIVRTTLEVVLGYSDTPK